MDQPDPFRELPPKPILATPTPPTAPPSVFSDTASRFIQWFQNHPRKKYIALAGVVAALALSIFVVKGIFGGISFFVPKTHYVQVYMLVDDKISQHAGIIVNLPKGASKNGAEGKVTFEPAIEGGWVASSLPDAIVYKPAKELSLGKHYLVSFATDAGTIKKDFLVDEDPKVINVFPDASAEAEPATAISIIFNRPMIPLTTLSEAETIQVPVTITPATPGKFKWISTRTLQFIPDHTLWGSAHYSVAIGSDFVSVEGLSIPSKTYTFTTKQLRLDHATTDTILNTQPIEVQFNEPVDLAKTTREIKVTNTTTRTSVPFVATYGTSMVWDEQQGKNKRVLNKAIISILPQNGVNGHANVWDYSTSYIATIGTAYPVGGDIPLTADGVFGVAVTANVVTSPILKEGTAHSDVTNLITPAMFDPSGTLTLSFYEDMNLSKSDIQAKGLKKIVYGKKCQDDTSNNGGCTQVDDQSVFILSFDQAAYGRGEKVPVIVQRLINAAGYQVNKEPLHTEFTVYPQLQILKTTPASGSNNASIQDVVLCTNVPLKAQEGNEFYQNFKANNYIVFGRWEYPYLETPDSWQKPWPCENGQYVNKVRYGLLPRHTYTIDVSVEDVFGQKANTHLSLNTEEAPKFYLRFQSLQKIYNVTTPEHTKLTFATENFDYVNAFICKVSPDTMVRYLALSPSDVSTSPDSALSCLSSVTKKIALTSDQWVNQYFQLDIKDSFPDPRGQYVVSFSHPQYQDGNGHSLYARSYISVTNLAVTDNRVKWTSYDYFPDVPNVTSSATRGSVFWLSRIHSLLPEVGAKIAVYQTTDVNKNNAPLVLAQTNTTNDNGFAEFPLIADVVGAAITSGSESAVLSTWADTLSQGSWSNAYQDQRTYVYTDRPIYRPGQEVFLKGLYRVNFDGAFEIFKDHDVQVTIRDSKGNTILTQNVPVSLYGTFAASVKLPMDAPLGTYSISALSGYSASFDVEEYVGAAFEAKASSNKEEYAAGDTATISTTGTYYFGVPLDGGSLSYSITSQNFYFDRYKDEYFNFGGDWYNCYDCGYGDTYLKSGKTALDNVGAATVSLPLDFNALYTGDDRNQSKLFVFHGTIKDKQGKSVSFQKSFIVHRGDYYLGVKADPSFMAVKQPFTLRLKTVDTKGTPVSESGITVTVNKVSWPSAKRQEVDGGYYNRPQRVLTPVITKTITTSGTGDYAEQLQLADAGSYEMVARGKDSHGNEVQGTSEIYIYGAGTVDVQPTNNATLNLTADKKDVKVGDAASFIIQNPYPHAKALVTIERGHIFTYEVIDLTQSIYKYSFPIKEEYTPNVFASVVLLSPGPEVKFGQLEFTVDKKQKELTIDIRADKQSYLPGQDVNLTITTTDAGGHPVPAEVSVAVADLSVLALKGNPKKDPLVFFYDGFPLTVTAETNIKNLLNETPIPTGTKGGDGGNPADLATRKRGEFKDTAFWQAQVVTDGQGVGHVSFKLPDNLTKWQIESVGITKDTKLGVKYQELMAQKDVMTVPLSPRFVVPGDAFMIGAKIFNQTANPQSLTISLESSSLRLEDGGKTQKTIKAGETVTVYFKVKAPLEKQDGSHTFTLSAKNNDYNDTVDQVLPITRNMTYESAATAGSTNMSSIAEYLYLPDNVLVDRGGLTIKTSATLAVYLSDALKYLFTYPYGCSEQLASKLSAIAVTKRALSVPNVGKSFVVPPITFNGKEYTADEAVTIGLNQVYDNQTIEGGFSYYKGLPADPYLTIQALNSLMDLKKSGYSPRAEVIDRTARYLSGQIPYFETHADVDTRILLVYVLQRAGVGSVAGVSSFITDKYLSDKASTSALGYLALLATEGGASPAFKDKVFAALINRVTIDSRGAYVQPNPNNSGWTYYETPEKDTALLIKALTADKREYVETPNLIRWLLSSRSTDGSWGSTNTSVAALDALSEYLIWKKETESSFTLATKLDDRDVSSTTFGKDNILSVIEHFLPINTISLGKLHALTFSKTNVNDKPNTFYYDLSLKYYLPVEQIAPRDESIAITRDFFALKDTQNTAPLRSAKVGEVIRGRLTIVSPKERHLFSVEDYIPAGFELVNFNLATEDQASLDENVGTVPTQAQASVAAVIATGSSFNLQQLLTNASHSLLSAFGFFSGPAAVQEADDAVITYKTLYPDFRELRNDRLFLFSQDLQPGEYVYEYYLRATTPGTFSHLPAVASELYFPENFGRTSGSTFTVEQ